MNEVEDRASCGGAPRSKQTKGNAFGEGTLRDVDVLQQRSTSQIILPFQGK